MDKLKEQESASVGRKIALWCALPAALFSFGTIVSKLLDIFVEPQERQQNLGTGLLYFGVLMPLILGTLYLSAAFLGRKAGKLIYRRMHSFAGAALVGICLACSCLVAMVVVWFIYNVVVIAITNSMILDAALWMSSIVALAVLLYGIVPAILLGLVYGILVRKRCCQD